MLLEFTGYGGKWSGVRFGVDYEFAPNPKYGGKSIAEVYDERVQKEMFDSGVFRKADVPFENDPANVRFVVEHADGIMRVLAQLSQDGVVFDRASKREELAQLSLSKLRLLASSEGIETPLNIQKAELVSYLLIHYEKDFNTKKKSLTFT